MAAAATIKRLRARDRRRDYRNARHGEGYDAFRTGLTFLAVRRMMHAPAHTPSAWRNKSRRAVLGFWHELKQQMWAQIQDAHDRA